MNPVRSIKNQYPGINAHLHSYWQGIGRWNRFHNYHIGQLMAALKAQLRPMGYTAEMEESLQIRRLDDTPRHPKADILISDLDPQRGFSSSNPSGVFTLNVATLLEEKEDKEFPYFAVAIYSYPPDFQSGEPVAWVELLSPSNKGGGQDARTYRDKRAELLRNGLVFVEIDYLHETPPTFWRLADYTADEPNAHPYRIVILDPRPDFEAGPASVKEFDVDEPIPVLEIPLNGGDKLTFDFGAPYQKTFEEGFFGDEVDYSQLPLNFERYSVADQQRIAARMLAVLEAAQAGTDLETASLTAKNLPLDEALKQIETLAKAQSG